jgi:DNA invertase Pin-like site-specific DNA recombinase
MSRTTDRTTLKAAIYARISSDKDGEGLGVERQEVDCRALADRLGFDVVQVYVENDTSASTKSRKPRPLYAEMIAKARSGAFDAIVAYSNSRLTRRPREFEDLIELAEARGVRIVTVVSGEDNLATADGRMVARIKASVDVGEAERTSERIRRQREQAAESGRYRGGKRPYGFAKDGVTVREAEAEVIRSSTEAVLAGRSLSSLARELNFRGLRTTTKKEWTYARLRDVLMRPRNAGLVSRGRIASADCDKGHREDGTPRTAVWPAIVDPDQWRACYDKLTDPARLKHHGTATRWLGSGIYICSRCGGAMRAAPYGSKPADRPYRYSYRCEAHAHLAIATDATDELVREQLAELVRDPQVVAALAEPDPRLDTDRERRVVLIAKLERYDRDYQAELIDGSKYKKFTAAVQAELAQVDVRIADAIGRATSSPVLGAVDPGAEFLAAPLDVQRSLLRLLMRVEVLPAARAGGRWSADRLVITRPEPVAA